MSWSDASEGNCMDIIDGRALASRENAIRLDFQSKTPFRYVVIDDFLTRGVAERIHDEFPNVDATWVNANGLHTKGKWTQPCVAGSIAERFYLEVNSQEFRRILGNIVGIEGLLADDDLNGAGYHQVVDGGFLNVHIDFNKLGSGLDRRLNLIVYLNHDWVESYGGFLELWDWQAGKRVANIAPIFNRCVIFETNEISYHGHPVPLNTKGKASRKSLSIYYYTRGREEVDRALATHSTIYVNTEGLRGQIKVLFNGVRDFVSLGWVKRRVPRRSKTIGEGRDR
jgi:2-oxoglutarate-Fe(II)-dependent oxygenase superfamily protein